jgi:hypothetical protein
LEARPAREGAPRLPAEVLSEFEIVTRPRQRKARRVRRDRGLAQNRHQHHRLLGAQTRDDRHAGRDRPGHSFQFEDKAVLEFFKTSGRNLLAAEAAAGIPYTIARSTQFMEFSRRHRRFKCKRKNGQARKDAQALIAASYRA